MGLDRDRGREVCGYVGTLCARERGERTRAVLHGQTQKAVQATKNEIIIKGGGGWNDRLSKDHLLLSV